MKLRAEDRIEEAARLINKLKKIIEERGEKTALVEHYLTSAEIYLEKAKKAFEGQEYHTSFLEGQRAVMWARKALNEIGQ